MVTIEVNNLYGKIMDKNLPAQVLSDIQVQCQFQMEGSEYKAYAYRKRNIKWDGYKKLFNKQTRRFDIGLLSRVMNVLKSHGYVVDIKDKRIHIDATMNYEYDASIPRDYQKHAIITSVMCGNGVLKVATGGGKTVIAGCTIGALNKKSIFIVHTKDLLYQAKDSFSRIFPNEHIGQVGDGIIDYQNITVATMQTLAILGSIDIEKNKYDEDNNDDEEKIQADKIKKEEFDKYRSTVQCIMMDEVQIVCSQTAQLVRFMFESADYAFGYSASPWRDDGSDLQIEGAFGNRIVDISASELIRAGYLVQPTIEVHKTHYPKFNLDKKDYVNIYKTYIVENTMRNLQVCQDAAAQWAKGYNTLILVTQIKHGQVLEEILNKFSCPAIFISGKSGMKKRRQAIEDMRNGTRSIMIASTIADVGLDIPRLQCIVEAGAGKSSVTALQRLGRIMRPFEGKDHCVFITYRDTAPFICQHIDRKIEIWRTENEFIIKEM